MTVIKKKKYNPARVPDDRRLAEVLKKFMLIGQPGSINYKMPPDKQVCVMEAAAYILGYDKITDRPPCTSNVIRTLMIQINDEYANTTRSRNQLKALIPYIINTAPTRWVGRGVDKRLIQDYTDPDYKKAEAQRQEIINALNMRKRQNLFGIREYVEIEGEECLCYMSMKQLIGLVKELADVARFDSAD